MSASCHFSFNFTSSTFSTFFHPSSPIVSSIIMSSLTPYDLNQLFAVSAQMDLVINEEKIDTKTSLENWISHLLQTSKWLSLRPFPFLLTSKHREFGKVVSTPFWELSYLEQTSMQCGNQDNIKERHSSSLSPRPWVEKTTPLLMGTKSLPGCVLWVRKMRSLRCPFPFALIRWSTERR